MFDTDQLYEQTYSDIMCEVEHFAAFPKEAPVKVQEAIDLAAATGLRHGDLVRLP